MISNIALLRGINVGGHRILKMDKLRVALMKNGFEDVTTYIQSGNILFNSKTKSKKQLSKLITQVIKSEFKLEVPVILTTPCELYELKKLIPVKMKDNYPPNHVFIIFLDKIPHEDRIKTMEGLHVGKGEFKIEDNYVIFGSGEGFSGSKMNTNFFEKKLKVIGTARNLKTLDKLLDLSGI